MEIVAICQEMGWDYYQYIEQPNWFLDMVRIKLRTDSERMKREMDKIRTKQH